MKTTEEKQALSAYHQCSGSIVNLDLQHKQSIVNLIQDVVNGNVSMRRAATEIQKQVPKKRLTDRQRKEIRWLRNEGDISVNEIAIRYRINPSTVWRICKSNDHS